VQHAARQAADARRGCPLDDVVGGFRILVGQGLSHILDCPDRQQGLGVNAQGLKFAAEGVISLAGLRFGLGLVDGGQQVLPGPLIAAGLGGPGSGLGLGWSRRRPATGGRKGGVELRLGGRGGQLQPRALGRRRFGRRGVFLHLHRRGRRRRAAGSGRRRRRRFQQGFRAQDRRRARDARHGSHEPDRIAQHAVVSPHPVLEGGVNGLGFLGRTAGLGDEVVHALRDRLTDLFGLTAGGGRQAGGAALDLGQHFRQVFQGLTGALGAFIQLAGRGARRPVRPAGPSDQ